MSVPHDLSAPPSTACETGPARDSAESVTSPTNHNALRSTATYRDHDDRPWFSTVLDHSATSVSAVSEPRGVVAHEG